MDEPKQTAVAVSKVSQLLQRLLSTVVLWALVLLVIFKLPPWWLYVVLGGIAAAALWEFYTMLRGAGFPCFKWMGVLGGVAVVLSGLFFEPSREQLDWARPLVGEFVVVIMIIIIFTRQLVHADSPRQLETLANTLLGVIYIGYMLGFIGKLVRLESPDILMGEHRFFLVYLILLTKFSDVGAYVTGSLFGRHKLIPRISPNKTWEGAAGALLIPLALSCVLFGLYAEDLERLGLRWRDAMILGLLIGLLAMIGDLAESLLKRQAKVKDSGHMIPGIGGALDLVDSLLFTAPVFYVYLRLFLNVPELK